MYCTSRSIQVINCITLLFLCSYHDNLLFLQVVSRVVFYSPATPGALLAAMAGAHALLDPYPAGGSLLPSLQALAVGLPVVTLPGVGLGSRLTLALYRTLQYGENRVKKNRSSMSSSNSDSNSNISDNNDSDSNNSINDTWERLVVSSEAEYVRTALALSLRPGLRERHSQHIHSRRHRLFGPAAGRTAAEDWRDFLSLATNTTLKLKSQ
jgi:hypothetical protein